MWLSPNALWDNPSFVLASIPLIKSLEKLTIYFNIEKKAFRLPSNLRNYIEETLDPTLDVKMLEVVDQISGRAAEQ